MSLNRRPLPGVRATVEGSYCMLVEKVLYCAQVKATAGRDIRTVSSDGVLDLKVTGPRELGGTNGWGTTPDVDTWARVHFRQDSNAGRDSVMDSPIDPDGLTRREFIVTTAAIITVANAPACFAAPADGYGSTVAADLEVNNSAVRLHVEPRVTLLDALRERLGLYGTKKGCDQGQYGAYINIQSPPGLNQSDPNRFTQ